MLTAVVVKTTQTMSWNPGTYNKFKSERFAPFDDLLALLDKRPGLEVIDLGCGTGELTKKLADYLPGSKVLGIDNSREMLNDSVSFQAPRLSFECRSIEQQVELDQQWDLVFSNAAVQWVDNHGVLIPKLISGLKPGGQLLIQIPAQHHNITNRILDELARQEPFKKTLDSWMRVSPVLDIEIYARIFFESGAKKMAVYEKVYPLVLENSGALFNWVSGTALLPYVEKLTSKLHDEFIRQYKLRLGEAFDNSPVFYPFKRIIMSASF